MRSPQPQRSPRPEDRRSTQRRTLNRAAKIQVGSGALPRDCLVTDISDGGVRIHVEGFEVPDDFVLLLSGEGVVTPERAYRVVWRLGHEIGASLVGILRRLPAAAR
jgi:PilZ domain